MNTIILFWTKVILILSLIQLNDCESQSKDNRDIHGKIILSTDRESYTKSDTIRLILENGSADDIMVDLRCGKYLEMEYQKADNKIWNGNLNPSYMSLRCPTLVDTLKAGSLFENSIPAEMFNYPGTFHLLVSVHSIGTDSTLTVVSNPININ